jgi:2-polyprenyl-6-methoxyphenol hydroxylase-like FAD-dependent oxidoreductase
MSEQIRAIQKVLLAGNSEPSAIITRAFQGLANTTDLYLEYSGQIKAKHLSTPGGRIGMIGDAAYCGTAITGQGTTLSLVGGYILAGELAKHMDDPKEAMKGYEAFMKPFAEDCQGLPPGVPHIALPNSLWGIRVLHGVVGAMVFLGRLRSVTWLAGKIAGWMGGVPTVLPDYTKYEVNK